MLSNNTEISGVTTGPSDSILLEPGLWNVFVTSPAWGNVDLQVSHDNETFFDLLEDGAVVNFVSNGVKEVNGGVFLRMDVNSISSGIYLVAKDSINK